MDNSNRPDIRAYIGATGSGKGVSIRAHLKAAKPKRFVAWDPLNEYTEFGRPVHTLGELIAAMKSKTFAVTYWPGADPKAFEDRFELFCRATFAAGNLVMLVEELADVTTPSRAPLAWRRCTTQGRHRGLQIIAASQRPAMVDKQFLGGCTYIRCFTLRYPADRAAMAGAMSVPQSDIDSLVTVEDDAGTTINFVERDFRGAKATKGRIRMQRR